ncbi:MAG: hydrogenase maturation protease [Thermoplasmata archaeon]
MRPDPRSGRERDVPPLVIGLGNEHRGDDAVGLLVARHVRPRLEGLGRVLELPADGTRLLDAWSGAGFAVVVDAVISGRAPGTVHRIEVGSDPLPSDLGTTSTHGFSLAHAVALGQALDGLPRQLVIYGVEGARFAAGDGVSPEVAAAIGPASGRIEEEVRRAAGRPRDRAGGIEDA